MLSEKEIMRIFRETQVWQEGHFLLTSGRHSGEYIQCARFSNTRVLLRPSVTNWPKV